MVDLFSRVSIFKSFIRCVGNEEESTNGARIEKASEPTESSGDGLGFFGRALAKEKIKKVETEERRSQIYGSIMKNNFSSESDEEEAFVPTRRPGERGKSAAKDELDSDEDSHSPIEG
jgi:hypothetical protein